MNRVRTVVATIAGISVLTIGCCGGRAPKLPDLTIVGAVGVGTLIVALAALAAIGWAGDSRRPAVITMVALFAGIVLTLAPVVGYVVRSEYPAQFAVVAGDRTSVTVIDDCTYFVRHSSGRMDAADHAMCSDATWELDGHDVDGTVIVDWASYEGGRVPAHVTANALGDTAYSIPQLRYRTSLARWGFVPLWPLWIGPVMTTFGGVLAFRRRRANRPNR